uniref:Uncharacterized protein n=1 Tax=Polyblepharides amylifera TaxID=1486889 RepID=A0A7R9SV11_9CHLO|mmetsp:Transcript_1201/g.1701  ORF Transcript_1201/g.1701 Transcript_1201/m.1701 type:complete len:238 (+) Transcript_1201:133-846(+)|eukprot:CAMPEP_0196579416 /NCGR_PEP_ID=MMETSP1081-20130531/21858_1 /TAXON_ID=36882 /ORGANISM="Pyramimonas amylifera, Strain CCMP720" /LENGTH=237 /DNA_ID=CAMNT_0041899003 /DNA_START=133 /DNA_END=846 /DNA_ORIENTATION=+
MGRGKNGSKRKSSKPANGQESKSGADLDVERAEQLLGATAMPADVNPNDAAVFYQIISSASWEEVEGKIQQVLELGLLSEGLLLAGFSILDKAQALNEDPRTVISVSNVCKRLTALLQEMKASPVLRLVDEWTKVLEADSGSHAEGAVKDKMKLVFEDGRVCTKESFEPEIKAILQMMEDQNIQFEDSVRVFELSQESMSIRQKAEIEESRRQRTQAVQNVTLLKDLAVACVVDTVE